jgi:hypothetical protein
MLTSEQQDIIRLARSLIRDAAMNWARDELAASPEFVCKKLSDMLGEEYSFDIGKVIPPKHKMILFGNTVLRKDNNGNLFLMNRMDTGWSSSSISIDSIEQLLDNFQVTLGEWSKDKFGEYCKVYTK